MSSDKNAEVLGPEFRQAHGAEEITAPPDYPVDPALEPFIRTATEGHPFVTYELMVAVTGSESGFRNVNSPTGCFGYPQFAMSTLLEAAYKYKDQLPDEYQQIVDNHIVKYNAAGKGKDPVYKYRIEGGEAGEAQVRRLATEAAPAFILMREYIAEITQRGERKFRSKLAERINWIEKNANGKYPPDDPAVQDRLARLKEHLARPLTYADVKSFYTLGENGGWEILLAYADPVTHDHRAEDYTIAWVAEANPSIFNKRVEITNPDTGETENVTKSRNVPEYFEYMTDRVGNQPIHENTASRDARFADVDHAPTTGPGF